MSTSEPEAEELRPLITHPVEQPRLSNWSLGCLCTVISLQVVCLSWLDLISNEAEGRFHVDIETWASWLAIPGIIYLYSLPILAGLYTDILVGRYRTLLFALGLYAAGKKSWKEIVRIFRTYVFCRKSQNEDDHTDDFRLSEERTRADELAKRRLDRLKLKKGVLMIALLSCTAVTLSMSFSANLFFNFSPHDYNWNPLWELRLVKESFYIIPIVGVTAFEIIRKYSGHHLWQNSCVNLLKTIGVGSSLAALSLALAGAVATQFYQHDEVMSPLWFLPSYFLMGLMLIFVYPPLMVLCYHESPPGMATVVAALAACLSVIYLLSAFLFVRSVATAPEPSRYDRADIVFYGLAGAMVVVVVALYTPISIMYIKTKRAIQEAEKSLDDTTSPETVASIVNYSCQFGAAED